MKKFYAGLLFVFFLVIVSGNLWAQTISETFNEATTTSTTGGTGMPNSGYGTGGYILSSGTWTFTNAIRGTSNVNSSPGCQIQSGTGNNIISPNISSGGLGTISFYAAGTSAGAAVNVAISINGAAYSAGTSFTGLTTTSTLKTLIINDPSANIKIKFTRTAGTLTLDDIATTGFSATPDIALSDNGTQIASANVLEGTNNLILHQFKLAVTSASTTLTGVTVTTVGDYDASDITNLKVRYSADAILDAGDATLSTFTSPGVAGVKVFPSFISQLIGLSTTGYVFITADVASGASTGGTKINVNAVTSGDLTFNSGNKTGTTTIGGVQTIIAATSPVLAISGTPTNHGTVCPTTSATPVIYTITNTGAAAAGITVVSSDPQFVVSGISSTTIAGSGGTATYTVTFTPASAGAKSATIAVASTTPGSNSPTSSLIGTGTTPIAGAVTTNAASLINNTVATLNGNLTTLAVCPATTEKGFVYAQTSANANPIVGGPGVTKSIVGSPVTGAYLLALSSLAPGTNYSYKAYIFDGTTYTYGAVVTFTTLQAADHLTFVSVPASGNVGVNLASFTVEARRPDNTVDNNVTSTTTISKASGPGNLTGTLSVAAVAGVATFSAAQFDAAGTYTISATSGGLTSALSGNITITNVSLSSDYFRSNTASGSWSNVTSWQSSHDNSFWFAATSVPTSSATKIDILNGHNISISTSGVTMTNTYVRSGGILTIATTSSYGISGAVSGSDQLFINSGGIVNLNVAGTLPIVGGNAYARVQTGGKLAVGPLCDDGTNIGNKYVEKSSGAFNFENAAIFEWNNALAQLPSNASQNYFYTYTVGDLPIFRINVSPAFNYGASNSNTFNCILEVNSPAAYGFTGTGTRTINGGIRGTGIINEIAGSGPILFPVFTPTPVLDGSITLNVVSLGLQFDGPVVIPVGANVLVKSSTAYATINKKSSLLVNGTIDVTDMRILNGSPGDLTVSSTGTLKTGNSSGFFGPSATITGGTYTLATGSTIEYNSSGAQAIQLAATPLYKNLTLSNAGVKTPSSAFNPAGTITIKDAAIFDCTADNVGDGTTNLTMLNNAVLLVGTTGVQPSMTGLYTLTGGTVKYLNNSITPQKVRNETFHNIDIIGTSVTSAGGNITLNDGAVFTVKTGGIFEMTDNSIVGPSSVAPQSVVVETNGTFKCSVPLGFIGPAAFPSSPAIRDNIETVTLNTGSLVEYSRTTPASVSGDQIITNTQPYQNLVLSGNGIKTAPAGTLVVNGNLSKTTLALFANNNGTVQFTSTTGQNYTSVSPAISFNNLLNNSTAVGLNINDSLYVEGQLTFGSNSKFNIASNKVVVLRSTLSKTANLAPVQSGALISYNSTGAFVVERYIPTGVRHSKSWQLLTAPTTGQKIKESWMENGAVPAGYGTIVTGTGTGFDLPTLQPSMKYYDYLTDSWKQVADPSATLITYKPGYLVFVRGDRSVTNSSTAANQTNLRTKGQVNTGAKPFNFTHTGFELTANPYPSPIDFDVILKTGIGNTFYVWDPSLYGSYGLGAYQTIAKNSSNIYLATPGNFTNTSGATPIYNTTSDYRNIQSGQAFFVAGMTANNILSFDETSKSAASTGALVNRGGTASRVYGNAQMLSSSLLAINGSALDMADGNRIFFDASNDNGLDVNDAIKLMNSGENFGLLVGDKKVAVENRQPVAPGDTIHYTMSRLKAQPYQLMFAAENMDPSLHAVLVDRWMQTRTAVSLTDTSFVPVNVTADAASQAADRFILVFDRAVAGPLPVYIIEVTATRNADRSIAVKWKVENEVNINKYEVERSADGRTFTSILTNAASAPSNGSAAYSKNDLSPLVADNYYRIKAISNDGTVSYSEIVKVSNDQLAPAIAVYPNPVVNKKLQLRFTNQQPGKFQLTLSNKLGQQVYTGSVTLGAANSLETVQLPSKLAQGVYQLTINGTSAANLQVIIE